MHSSRLRRRLPWPSPCDLSANSLDAPVTTATWSVSFPSFIVFPFVFKFFQKSLRRSTGGGGQECLLHHRRKFILAPRLGRFQSQLCQVELDQIGQKQMGESRQVPSVRFFLGDNETDDLIQSGICPFVSSRRRSFKSATAKCHCLGENSDGRKQCFSFHRRYFVRLSEIKISLVF